MALAGVQPDGDNLGPAEIEGHLLLVIPTEYLPAVKTQYNTADKPTSPAVRVDVAVLTQRRDNGDHPVYRGVLWFNVRLLALRKQIGTGETVIARMRQGQKQPGQSAPWYLEDALGDADAVAYATDWLARHPEFEAEAARAVALNAADPANNHPTTATTTPATPQAPSVPSVPQVPATPTPQVSPVAAPTPAAVDPLAQLAGLPPEELAKVLAVLNQQQPR